MNVNAQYLKDVREAVSELQEKESLDHAGVKEVCNTFETLLSIIDSLEADKQAAFISMNGWKDAAESIMKSKQRLVEQIQNGEEIHFATLDSSDLPEVVVK